MPKEEKLQSPHQKTLKTQKKVYLLICVGIIGVLWGAFTLFSGNSKGSKPPEPFYSSPPETASHSLEPKNFRLSQIEWKQDEFENILTSLVSSQEELKETLQEVTQKSSQIASENVSFLKEELEDLKVTLKKDLKENNPSPLDCNLPIKIASLEEFQDEETPHVSAYIPAGTVVRCILVSAADCSVGVQQPKGPAKMLIRPLENGQLPRKVRVALKDSVILASAYGDLANERVYVRADRMTLVEPNGDFVETEVSAYVSGEDGREGVRGIVVDRSGSIITRAAFASFLQGIGQGVQATLNNQTIEKLSKVGDSQTILDVDTFRNAGMQGANTALNKLADYYIKRAEQLQPSIQVAAGRVIDLIFTHGVKIGENNLRKKLEIERSLAKEKKHG
ncbi:TraB/VirB10 family protein [Candidatus Neptunochlamydia vexilliferae]|nr:TraB/VirB10 family protein [Candidatus Neptunochlamydia vexilliferae]